MFCSVGRAVVVLSLRRRSPNIILRLWESFSLEGVWEVAVWMFSFGEDLKLDTSLAAKG
jgi:hypothetical protein